MMARPSNHRESWAASVVLGLSIAFGTPASAMAQPASALIHFDAGVSAYDHGEFELAAREFELAYAERPNALILYNLAMAYEELHRYAEATDAYERYLEEVAATALPERVASVRSRIERISGLVARIRVLAEGRGATIRLDGQALGVSPLSVTVRVNSGRHTIEASFPDREPETQTVDLAGSSEVAVRFEDRALVSESPIADEPARRRVPIGEGTWRTIDPSLAEATHGTPVWVWVTGAVGLGAIGVGAGFGVDFFAKDAELTRNCPNEDATGTLLCDGSKYTAEDAQSLAAARNRDLGALIGLGAAGVATLGFATIGFFTSSVTANSTGGASPTPRLVPRPWVARGSGGLFLQGEM